MNYRPILCMLVKDSSVSGDSLGKNGVNFASLPAYSYYLDDLCVCPNGTPSASDLYGIIRVMMIILKTHITDIQMDLQ